MKENKRKRSRLPFHSKVTIGTGRKSGIVGKIKDISMNGIFILSGDRIPIGTVCGIEIILTGKSSNLRIRAQGVVTRHTLDGIGIKFHDDLEWWPVLENKCIDEFELNLKEKPF